MFKNFTEWLWENESINLWLDDNRDPSDPDIQIKYGAKGNEIWVKSADEALKYLETGKVVSMSFDHDIGLSYDDRGNEKNGYWLAKKIAEMAYFNKIPRFSWRVHSSNTVGLGNITATMQNAEKYWSQHEQEDERA